jgi:hypothetical protein
MLRYILELSHNASKMWRKVIVSFSYRSGLIDTVIASYSHRFYSHSSSLIGIVIASYSYRSKVTKLLLPLTTTPGFPTCGVYLTSHARLRAQDTGEVVLVLFRIARAEWSQCRHRLALDSWGYGKLERME